MNLIHATIAVLPNPFRQSRYVQMEATLRQWHEDSLDDLEYVWLEPNFEQMADAVNKAVFCAETPRDMTPDDSWMARQDAAVV